MESVEPVENDSQQIPAAERELLAGAERRIARALWVLGIVGMLVCWLWRDWRWGSGFVLGAVLSALNFSWMKGGVEAMAEAASTQAVGATVSAGRSRARSAGVLARFVLRYALLGGVGYVILKSSFISLTAFFLGLFLIILAILTEMAYQVFCAFRKA